MNLLTDNEISNLWMNAECSDKSEVHNFAEALQAAWLEKLASAELPEPVSIGSSYVGVMLQVFTADQLRQAYAQGAAAQLAEKPTCWVTPDGEGFRMRLSPPVNAVPLGWQELYTRRQA